MKLLLDNIISALKSKVLTKTNGSVKSQNIDWATMKMPCVSSTVLQEFPDVEVTTDITVEHTGFLRIILTVPNDASADVRLGNELIEGITYNATGGVMQQTILLPVSKGTTFQLFSVHSGKFANIKVLAPSWGS